MGRPEHLVHSSHGGTHPQTNGSAQTSLGRLLFILLQTVLFHDVQCKYLAKHPLSVAPQIPFFDIEYADDTVLIARTGEHMQDLLRFVQNETSKHNLHLNMDKTKLILYNSDNSIAFRDGSLIQQASSVIYLGGLTDEPGKPGPEVRRRLGEARQVFQKLKRVWKRAGLSEAFRLQGLCCSQTNL